MIDGSVWFFIKAQIFVGGLENNKINNWILWVMRRLFCCCCGFSPPYRGDDENKRLKRRESVKSDEGDGHHDGNLVNEVDSSGQSGGGEVYGGGGFVRGAGGTMGECVPYAHVDGHLRALAGQAEGFGRFSIGGLHGSLYQVTSLADSGPGTLREGCKRKEPLWIVFEVSGTINLLSYLRVSSYKTIDGRGHRIKLVGKGLQLKECEHIIINNLEFEGGRGPDVDGIQIKPKSRHIWIDRCSLHDYDDGLIDITRGSTDITISRCHFFNHDKTMLIGADPTHVGDRCIKVTIHHCFFDGTTQRHPRVRFGKVHLYNNYTRNWGIYAVCGSVESQILSQCNIYEAGNKKLAFKYLTEKAADKDEPASGCIRSEGDLFLNGAQGPQQDAEKVFRAHEFYPTWTMESATATLREVVQLCCGQQSIQRPPDLGIIH